MPPKGSTAKTRASKKRHLSPEGNVDAASDKSSVSTKVDEQPTKRAKVAPTSTSSQTASATAAISGTSDSPSQQSQTSRQSGAGAENVTNAATEDSSIDTAADLSGAFDLYGMDLPFLNKVYRPSNQSTVQPEALFKTILTYQAKNDRTGRITIPTNYATGGTEGTFSSPIFCDPFDETPFGISITGFEVVDEEDLGPIGKYGRPKDSWNGPGLEGRLEITDGGCGIASSSGDLLIRPMWRSGSEGEEKELFEGSFSFDVRYSSMYSRKGHGKGQELELAFWAIRTKKN